MRTPGNSSTSLNSPSRLGLDELWLGDEGPARDPFALLGGHVPAATRRLRLGIAVTNPYLRLPAVAAAAGVTLQELSGGRIALGFGTGGGWALEPLGIRPRRRFGDTERALITARAVSERRAVDGYVPAPHAVGPTPLPLFVGSRSERLNRFASHAADGIFVGGVPVGVLDRVIGWARSEHPIDVALYLDAAFDEDAREQARPQLVRVLIDSPAYVRDHVGRELADLLARGGSARRRRRRPGSAADHGRCP